MAPLFAATAVVVPFENLGVSAVDSVGWEKNASYDDTKQ